MRHAATAVLATCLLAAAAIGCSNSDDEAKDCATALTQPTGSNSADTPTLSEAKERVDALNKTLASMVDSGYESVASKAYDAVDAKNKSVTSRPEACKPLSEKDYQALLTAKTISGLGWTGKDGQFDKLRMAERLG